jgi:hypothetical protein
MLRRIAPAIGLFFLSPLVAEFLLGNISIAFIAGMLFLSAMYGGGALLIREVARRTGRGWPTIILLALAYGVVEEGLVTQSLFNPDYAGQHLLSYGHIDALGMGSWWTLFVLTLHTVWSISVPIALMEAMVPTRRTTPWLGRIGLPIVAALFVLGCVLNFVGSLDQSSFGGPKEAFFASPGQFIGAGVAIVVLIVLAFVVGRRRPKQVAGPVPSPAIVGGISLVASSVFLMLPHSMPAWLICVSYLVLYAVVAFLASFWSRRSGWRPLHTAALAGGALVTYAWHGFLQPSLDQHNSAIDLIGNAVFAAIALAVLAAAVVRTARVPEGAPTSEPVRS